jgi:hypothetical protein
MLLEIAIPTFCRPHQLHQQLSALSLASGIDEVLVSVYNNDPSESLAGLTCLYPISIRVFDSSYNIGAELNMLKALSNAVGDYLWLLSDDDIIAADAVSVILANCRDSNWPIAKYHSPLSNRIHQAQYNIQDILLHLRKDRSYFSNFLFVSTLVVQPRLVKPYMHSLYQLSFSCAIGLCIPLVYLLALDSSSEAANIACVKHFPQQIINSVPPGGWSPIQVYPRILLSSLVLSALYPSGSISPLSLFTTMLQGIGLRSFLLNYRQHDSSTSLLMVCISLYSFAYIFIAPLFIALSYASRFRSFARSLFSRPVC